MAGKLASLHEYLKDVCGQVRRAFHSVIMHATLNQGRKAGGIIAASNPFPQ